MELVCLMVLMKYPQIVKPERSKKISEQMELLLHLFWNKITREKLKWNYKENG